jgi:hypothetical protein
MLFDAKKNALSGPQKYTLAKALERRLGEFEAEGLTLPRAARRLGEDLGFKVTARNLNWALETIGKTWKRGRTPGQSTTRRSERRGAALAVLVREHIQFWAELGKAPNPRLVEFLDAEADLEIRQKEA